MPDEKDQTSRVAMLWPEDLKAQVRDRVGARGLTKFTLEAVEAKLGNHDVHQANSVELEEVRFLAQQLADVLARGGEYEDRYATLQEIGLPEWIDTTGWPEDLAGLVPRAEPANDPTTYEDDGIDIGEQLEPTSAPKLAADLDSPSGDELLERIRDKAAEKGVDLSGLDLKPASTITTVVPPAEEPVAEEAPVEPAASNPDACPNCGSPLVVGECWECF